ncbi:hypothetical protein ACFLXI_01810 [Chloroflexota bacterium]
MNTQNNIPQEYLYGLAASPDFLNDGVLFAAKQSGLYRSTDHGQNWIYAYDSLGLETFLPTTALALSPNYSGDQTVFAAVEGNILRSTDGGQSWVYTELVEPAPLVSVLGISPNFSEDGLLLAGTLDDGIVRSTTRSATWHRWNFGLLDPHIYALAFSLDGTILAGAESGIYRSTNRGRAWREVDFPMDLAPVINLAASGEAIFAGTEENGLYISKDGGNIWTKLAPDTIQGAVIQVLVDGTDVLAVLEDGVWFSGDQGKSWDLRKDFDAEKSISYVAAPLGHSTSSPLWVGLFTGEIIKIGGE